MVGKTWWQFSFPGGGGEEIASYTGIMSGWVISYQGNQLRGKSLTLPLISIVESSDLKLEQSLAGAWANM